MTDLSYTRPELTPEEKQQAQTDGLKLTANRSVPQLRALFIAMCQENMRCLKEINEHRAARGIEPLRGFKVP